MDTQGFKIPCVWKSGFFYFFWWRFVGEFVSIGEKAKVIFFNSFYGMLLQLVHTKRCLNALTKLVISLNYLIIMAIEMHVRWLLSAFAYVIASCSFEKIIN